MSKLFKKNNEGRDFCVSDLHGCFDLFQSVLDDISFDKKIDRMFSVGDLIDRGDKSIECLRLIKEDWFFPVMGNHDSFLVESILHEQDPYLWVMNGGAWYVDADEDELIELAWLVIGLPYSMMIETDNGVIAVSHAQPPSLDWKDAVNPGQLSIDSMLWGRDWIKKNECKEAEGVYCSIHGHTIINEPVRVGNAFFIDTGAFYTGKLTCINLNNYNKNVT